VLGCEGEGIRPRFATGMMSGCNFGMERRSRGIGNMLAVLCFIDFIAVFFLVVAAVFVRTPVWLCDEFIFQLAGLYE